MKTNNQTKRPDKSRTPVQAKSETNGKTLLRIDTETMDRQRNFLRMMAHHLTQVCEAWNDLDIQPAFELADIDRVERYSGIEFVKAKVIPALSGTQIGGVKLPPERLFELMEKPDFSGLYLALNEVVGFIKDTRRTLASYGHQSVEYNSDFFVLEEGEVKVNEQKLLKWYDQHCHTYAATENQVKVFNCLKKLADAMNELKQTDLPPPNSQARRTTYDLKIHPGSFMRHEMSALLKVDDGGTFLPNVEFVLKH
ncbi:MAG: hypothetical protein KF803_08675 [Cyclobacteriaceae bacterium]|nr:hypothetical protein [Cyclobacteriaceae bacterium]